MQGYVSDKSDGEEENECVDVENIKMSYVGTMVVTDTKIKKTRNFCDTPRSLLPNISSEEDEEYSSKKEEEEDYQSNSSPPPSPTLSSSSAPPDFHLFASHSSAPPSLCYMEPPASIGPPSPFPAISSSRVASSYRRKEIKQSGSILAASPPHSPYSMNRYRPQSKIQSEDYCNDNYDGEEQVKKFQELLEQARRSVGNSPSNSPYSANPKKEKDFSPPSCSRPPNSSPTTPRGVLILGNERFFGEENIIKIDEFGYKNNGIPLVYENVSEVHLLTPRRFCGMKMSCCNLRCVFGLMRCAFLIIFSLTIIIGTSTYVYYKFPPKIRDGREGLGYIPTVLSSSKSVKEYIKRFE